MTTPSYTWTADTLGGHHLTAEGVEGNLARVLKIMSLVAGKPIGCFIEHPGWTGEKCTVHATLDEAKTVAATLVGPYVLKQLAAKAAAQAATEAERRTALIAVLSSADGWESRPGGIESAADEILSQLPAVDVSALRHLATSAPLVRSTFSQYYPAIPAKAVLALLPSVTAEVPA